MLLSQRDKFRSPGESIAMPQTALLTHVFAAAGRGYLVLWCHALCHGERFSCIQQSPYTGRVCLQSSSFCSAVSWLCVFTMSFIWPAFLLQMVGAYPFERPEDKNDTQKLQKMIQVSLENAPPTDSRHDPLAILFYHSLQ